MWRRGMTCVDQLVDEVMGSVDGNEMSSRQKKAHQLAHATVHAIEAQDLSFFYQHLPSNQHWRLLGENIKTAYLDIETTGLDPLYAHITTICVYDGTDWKTYVHGRNLHEFKTDIQRYDLLVTYNGKTFDIPFINSFFNIEIDTPHVDLRYPLAAQGFKGGLKSIEHKLGLGRTGAIGDVDGFLAVHLWNEYALRGNPRALETLLAYNLEDVFNLAPLGARVFNLCLPECFDNLQLKETYTRPEIPYAIDENLVLKLKARMM